MAMLMQVRSFIVTINPVKIRISRGMIKLVNHFSYQKSVVTLILAGREVRAIEISAHLKWLEWLVGKVQVANGRFENDDYTYGVIHSLWVHLFFRRLGMGKMLMLEIMREAKAQGKREIFLACEERNRGALKFYSRLGFQNMDKSELAGLYDNEIALYWPQNVVGLFLVLDK